MSRTTLNTVGKAGQVFTLFTLERPEWGVGEVSETLNFPKSSTSVLLSTLAELGLLRRTSSRRYRLGWRIMALSHILLETTEFRAEARRAMEYLVSRFGELVHLAAFEHGRVIYVDKIQGTRAVQVAITAVGVTLPAHGSGVGKILLADRPWEDVTRILEEQGMPALTPNTLTTPEDLREELEAVRTQGFAYDLEETTLDLCCVAAPIRDHTGEVVAALSFSVPKYRFEPGRERYRAAILEAARTVSRNIGYFGRVRSTREKGPRATSGTVNA